MEGLCELPPDAQALKHIDTDGWSVGRDGPIKLSNADRLGEGELSVMEVHNHNIYGGYALWLTTFLTSGVP